MKLGKNLRKAKFAYPSRIRRTNPLATIFWIALLLIIIGAIFPIFAFLILIGLLILVIYIAYFFIWINKG